MPVLLGILIAGIAAYLIYRFHLAPAAAPAGVAGERSGRGFAFLSNGLLFYREPNGEVKQVHSTYAQEATDRRERSRERHSWKQGTSFSISAGGNSRNFDAADAPILATSAVFEPDGNLLYFQQDEHVGGLFRHDMASGRELRLLLRQNLRLADLSLSPDGTQLAASSPQSAGVANIVLMKSDGSNLREATGGDTLDTAPAWIPGAPRRLLFQSSGLARDAQGYIVAQGHASIQKLDMDTGSVTPVREDPRFDYLKPRVSPNGDLHCIRRPYQAPRYGAGSLIMDTLLFPFRLLRAVFHYLNFFSLMYTRKPLTTASGPAMQADLKNILLQGRRVDAEKALRSARPVNGVPSLVPESWQLLCVNQDGNERVLATNVASYDLSPDGTVTYSNGRGVFVLDKDGTSRLAATQDFVGEVVASSN
jgi:hypothetical protein